MKKAIPQDLIVKFKGVAAFALRYKVLILLIMVAAAVGFTTLKSQSYLAPARDENSYSAKTTELTNFKSIDTKFANELKQSETDIEVTVDPSLPNDRTNPFTE